MRGIFDCEEFIVAGYATKSVGGAFIKIWISVQSVARVPALYTSLCRASDINRRGIVAAVCGGAIADGTPEPATGALVEIWIYVLPVIQIPVPYTFGGVANPSCTDRVFVSVDRVITSRAPKSSCVSRPSSVL